MDAELTECERDEIRQVFRLFDVDNTGKINVKELHQTMKELEMNPNNTTNEKFLQRLSKSKQDELDFDAFQRLVIASKRKRNDWKSVFEMFDVDKKGFISKSDLRNVADSLGEEFSENELQEMMDRASSDKNDKVTFDEFQAIMTKNLFSQ